jgi:methylenetetrahydrofolate reductase (NADPH)
LAPRQSVREQLAVLKAMGVRRLVALRGDLPSGYGAGGEFQYASDLVAFIREETGGTSTSRWPPTPGASATRSPEADLKAYVAKVRAGRCRHHPVFLQQRCVLPLCGGHVQAGCRHAGRAWHHAHQLYAADALSDACGAEIPRWIRLRLQRWRRYRQHQAFGLDVVTDLCDQLRSAGVPALHFYTMNQSAATLESAADWSCKRARAARGGKQGWAGSGLPCWPVPLWCWPGLWLFLPMRIRACPTPCDAIL